MSASHRSAMEQPQPIPFDLDSAIDTGITILGTRQCGKTTLAIEITNLLRTTIANFIIYVLDPTCAWQNRIKDFNVIAIPPRTRIETQLSWQWTNTIFDLSRLAVQDQQAFTEVFSEAVLNAMIELNPETRPQIWIWFEEAHTPMPPWIFSSNKRLPQTGRLITQGANFGIAFGLITQFPAMISKLPVKATQQRYFGLTSEPNDVKYLRQYIDKEWSTQLEDLNKGEFIYKYGKTIKRFRMTTPEYTDNLYFTYCCGS